MRILHLCLSAFYIDNYGYQENILPIINYESGHDVKIIASTETYINNQYLGYVEAMSYETKEGIPVERLPYKKYLPHFMMKKIRSYSNLYKKIEEFNPEVILSHGVPMRDLLVLHKYKQNNEGVRIYIDSHEDLNNSATNWISKNILHRIIYRSYIKRTMDSFEKILYITAETRDFLEDIYNISNEKLEYYPLGGSIVDSKIIEQDTKEIRNLYNFKNDDILVFHSGKISLDKKIHEYLDCFIEKENIKLIIAGKLEPEVEDILKPYLGKDNIYFAGWLGQDELKKYLNACDLYFQPGSQSATLQQAICSNSAVAIYPHKSYKELLENVPYYISSPIDMNILLSKIKRDDINTKKIETFKIAQMKLDYRYLAERYTV